MKLAVWSYLLKILLTGVLYYASIYGWPIFREYQGIGREGFWVFADDAQAYHNFGHCMADAWAWQGSFPPIVFENWLFIAYIGLIYSVFGVHPLNVSFLNAWYGTCIIGAGLVMMRRLGASARSIRLGVALLAFWPSLLLWSSQPMKDPLTLMLVMLGLCVLVLSLDLQNSRSLTWFWLAGLLGVLLALFRIYAGLVFGVTMMIAHGWVAIQALRRRAYGFFRKSLAVMVFLPLALFAVTQLDFQMLINRSKSEAVGLMPEPAHRPPGLGVVLDQAKAVIAPLTPQALNSLRQGFILTGGHSLIDPDVTIPSLFKLVAYLPRSLSIAVLAPFPWQWFDVGGRTRAFRAFTAVEALLVYFLLAGVLGSVWKAYRHLGIQAAGREVRRSLGIQTVAIWCFIVFIAVPMSLTVANLGTLFRLRLQFVLPLAVLACLVDIPGLYRRR